MRIGSVFSYRFFGSFRRFNGDLDNDLPHRPALARGDARRVRVLLSLRYCPAWSNVSYIMETPLSFSAL